RAGVAALDDPGLVRLARRRPREVGDDERAAAAGDDDRALRAGQRHAAERLLRATEPVVERDVPDGEADGSAGRNRSDRCERPRPGAEWHDIGPLGARRVEDATAQRLRRPGRLDGVGERTRGRLERGELLTAALAAGEMRLVAARL